MPLALAGQLGAQVSLDPAGRIEVALGALSTGAQPGRDFLQGLGPGLQRCAQLVALAGGILAHPGRLVPRISRPGLSSRDTLGRLLGLVVTVRCLPDSGITCCLGATDLTVGLGARLADGLLGTFGRTGRFGLGLAGSVFRGLFGAADRC